MGIEQISVIIATIGVLIALCAWLFPRTTKTASKEKTPVTEFEASSRTPISNTNQIEIAMKHLEMTTYDNQKTEYLSNLGKRIECIELNELTKLLSILTYDSNKVISIAAFKGKVSADFSAKDYVKFLDEFTYSRSKQIAAESVNA